MKIRIQGSKVIKFIKAKNGRTYQEAYSFNRYGVSNLMRRISQAGSFTFDDDQSLENFERLADLLKTGRLF